MKKVRKNKFLSMFSIVVTMLCVLVAMSTFVFAYVPTIKWSMTLRQTLTSKLYLTHVFATSSNNVTLFSTVSDHEVATESVGTGKTYQVKPLADNLIQVKAKYSDLKYSSNNNAIVFTVTSTTNNTIKLDGINVYGVDLPLPNPYMTATLDSTYTTLTIKFNSILPIENDDYVACNLYFTSNSNNLPAGYTELEYLESTGTQYIDTGIIPTNHYSEVVYDSEIYNEDEHLFGTDVSYKYYHFSIYGNKYYWGQNGTQSNGGSWSTGKKTLQYNYGDSYQVILDGTVLGSGTNITSSSTLFIFRRTETTNFEGKLYSFKITDKSTNTLVRDYVPMIRNSDNVIGLYDRVNNVFYTNAGNGTFVAGPDVD